MSASTILTSKRTISAIVCSLSLAAMAATPVAVWDGDFTTLTKGTFTLSENGNTKTDSYLQISGNNGITVTSTDALNVFTVIMRCSGLDLAAANAQVLFTSYGADASTEDGINDNMTGVNLPANNAVCRGIWQAADWNNGATQGSVPANYTTLIYNHQQTSGTYAYALGPTSSTDETVVRTTLYSVVGLRSSGTTYKGFAVGGLRGTTSATLLPATGLKITSIAVFSGTLTEAEMKAYSFPSETQRINITSNTSVSAINAQMDSGRQGVDLVVTDGVTITFDEQFTPTSVNITSSGSITLSAKVPPSTSELSKLDLSGVQGSVVRTWLNPGVVGYNFRNDSGGGTAGQLGTGGTWLISANSANGTDVGLFADGLSKLSWSASGTYASGVGSSITTGYLDDNSSQSPVVMLSAVPYASYDVVIYCSTDSDNFKFSAKEVNGNLYTWDGSKTIKTTDANAAWGQSKSATIVEGTNALRINGLTGPLTIKGGKYSNTADLKCRSCIAAIQIMPAGVSSGKSEIVIDATEGWTTTDSDMLGSIRTSYRNVRVLGSGQYGATLDFGYLNDDSMYISSHIVFDGGTHAVTIKGSDDSTIGSNASEPILEVLDGTTLDFYQHDLSGWLGSAAAKVPTCNIQVDDGGQLNIKLSEPGTTYYQGRYTIYPGATVTSYVTTGNDVGSHLRFNGGAVQGAEQIYVPATTTSEPGVATFNGIENNTGIFLASDETAGLGIFVGDNSTLEFGLDIAGVAAAPLAKWGEGRLNFNGDLSSYVGTLTVNEGTVQFGETTIASLVNNGYVEIIYGGEDGGQVIGTKITSYSGTGEIEVMLTQNLLDEIESNPASAYTILPGVQIRSDKVRVGNAPAGYSVHVSGNGMVLSNGTDGNPEWTGASNDWNASQFDGKQFSTESMDVFFSQGEQPETAVTVTANHAPTANSITFLADDTAYTLSPHSGPNAGKVTSTGTLTVSGLAPVRVETPLEVAGISLAAGTEFTYANTALTIPDGELTGSGKFILDPGEGKTNTMSSANTSFTGEAVIASGVVKMGDLNSFGSIGDASRYIRVRSGATLDANHAAAISTAYTVRKNQVLLEEGAVFTSSTAHNDRKLSGFQVVKLAGDASIRADVVPVSLSLHYNYYQSRLELGSYKLSKIGTNELYLSTVAIEGTGKIDVLEGYVTIVNSYNSAFDTSSFANGTLKIAHGAGLKINFYNGGDKGTPSLAVKNLELDGTVAREKAESTLTVTGYVTGNGTTPMLTLAEGAVFKPTGTGYLTITESLTLPSVLTNDVSGIDFDSASTVPLFKVGSSEMLPEAESMAFSCGALPKRWSLEKTSNGLGYRLKKEMSFSIRLR